MALVNRELAGRVIVAIALIGAVGGCGPRKDVADPAPATPSAVATPGNIVPGGFEPVKTGESLQAARDTGLIVRDKRRERICEGISWKWKGQLAGAADIIVNDDEVVSLGLRKSVIKTATGLTIGSTYAEVKTAYGDELTTPAANDYGQAGVFVSKDDDWIGFLFDQPPAELTDSSEIVFIEVSHGRRPGLLRDGC
jgi:hypothetical protein